MAARQDEFHANVDVYLQQIFGGEFSNAWVTGFNHDPAASSTDGRIQAIAWGGAPYARIRDRIRPDSNNYLCISTFRVGDDGRARRRTALHKATYAFMIDDVGEKVPLDRIALPPTLAIQTSPGSQQYWYILREPEADGAAVRAVIDNLINKGLMSDNKDPGMRGVNRYGRLPFGLNTKAKYKRKDGSYPEVHMVSPPVWEHRYTVAEFCEAYGVSSTPLGSGEYARAPIPEEAEQFNIALLEALHGEGYYKEDKGGGKHDVTCPWFHEHTGHADNGAAVFEAGHIDVATGETYPLGGYRCHHGHGEKLSLKAVVRLLKARGYSIEILHPARVSATDDFADAPPIPVPDDELLDLPVHATHINGHDVLTLPATALLPEAIVGKYEPSDVANAARLAKLADGRLRYHVETGNWIAFDGRLWGADLDGVKLSKLTSYVGTHIWEMAGEARSAGQDDVAKALEKWALASRQKPRIEAMTWMLKAREFMPIHTNEMDGDPRLLGCSNGVVDLARATLLPPDRSCLVVLNTGAPYDADAEAPDWEPYLQAILSHPDGTPDSQLYAYFRSFLGYCVTGLRTIELFTILFGSGTNGKSTLLAVLEKALGDYGRRVRPELFEVQRTQASAATPELAVLPGSRILVASESSEGAKLNMEMVKQMTGDSLSARHLYQGEFSFTPTFKAMMSTNHLPIITGTDHATWRRIHPIPFERRWRLPTDPSSDLPPADLGLRERLLGAQLPGVLAWLVRAARDFLATEMLPEMPARVRAAQSRYRNDSDVIGKFINEVCEIGAGRRGSGLYLAYRHWAEENGLRSMSAFTWGRQMTERFGEQRMTNGVKYYDGVELRKEQQ
jgi:putative DNA primase/helicase